MRRVYSLAYFRSPHSAYESENAGESRGKFYTNFLSTHIRAFHAIWALGGWEMRIYHDDRVRELPYFKALEVMHLSGLLKLVGYGACDTLCGRGGMLMRLQPAFESDVRYCVCRDVDSVPVPRDRRAVEEFILSGKAVHVIHEAEAHSGIMGGTMAVNASLFREVTGCSTLEQFLEWKYVKGYPPINWDQHGADQDHLNRHLLPACGFGLLVHDLHHLTDMASTTDVRTEISSPMPHDIHPEVASKGDGMSHMIGGCVNIEKPLAFYDCLNLESMQLIRECEREAGIAL